MYMPGFIQQVFPQWILKFFNNFYNYKNQKLKTPWVCNNSHMGEYLWQDKLLGVELFGRGFVFL